MPTVEVAQHAVPRRFLGVEIGSKFASTPMIAITTSNSIRVKRREVPT
jgi:hypothetical protein